MQVTRPSLQELLTVWFWTLLLFSGALVAACWSLLVIGGALPRHPKYYDQILMEWSTPVILLLFATSFACRRTKRRLAVLGFFLCLVWLIYALLPRF